MVTYLNKVAVIPEEPDYLRKALHDFQEINLDGVFAKAALSWRNGSEKELKSQLLDIIGQLQNINCSQISGLDLLFHDVDSNDDDKKSVTAIFDFGCEHGNWWTKQTEVLSNVSKLCQNADINYKFDQPMLLASITMNKSKCNSNEFKKETPIDKIHFDARFAVFLCVPKVDPDHKYWVSMLWRANTTKLDDTSRHFGKVLNTVQLCSHLRKYCNTYEDTIKYEYLSPDCCRFGDK